MNIEVECSECCSLHKAELAIARSRLADAHDEIRRLEARLRIAERSIAAQAQQPHDSILAQNDSPGSKGDSSSLPFLNGRGSATATRAPPELVNVASTSSQTLFEIDPSLVVRWYSRRLARNAAWEPYPAELQAKIESGWLDFLRGSCNPALATLTYSFTNLDTSVRERFVIRFDAPHVRQASLVNRDVHSHILRSIESAAAGPPPPSTPATVPPPPGSHMIPRVFLTTDLNALVAARAVDPNGRYREIMQELTESAVVTKPDGVFTDPKAPVLVEDDELRREFETYDVDADGYLPLEAFKKRWMTFETYGVKPREQDVDALLAKVATILPPAIGEDGNAITGKPRVVLSFDGFQVMMLRRARM